MTLTTADLFEYARNDNLNNYDIKITYVEIYNEVIRDLLVAKSDHLDLREDPIKVKFIILYYFMLDLLNFLGNSNSWCN